MKAHLLLALCLALPGLAQADGNVSAEEESVVQELAQELNLEPAEAGEETETLTVHFTQETDGDPKPNPFKIRPFLGISIGSPQIGLNNVTAGIKTHYFSADTHFGYGVAWPKNVINIDDGKNGTHYFSAALRGRVNRFVEVGLRTMKVNAGSSVKPEYSQSFRSLGYDVKVNVLYADEGFVNGSVSFSGLKKKTLMPNLVQVGINFNLRK